jgi:negative regulator of genetic competence, sporulation and motility
MKKLVKESLYTEVNKDHNIPDEIVNLFLDISNDIQLELNLPHAPVEEMFYDRDAEQYIAVLPETEDIHVSYLDSILDMVYDNYGSYSKSISIEYSKEYNGIIIRLDASYF